MLGWSINLFRIRGIRLQLHFTFLLLVAYIGYVGWTEARWPGLLWGVATILTLFTCVILHELGHSFTAMRFGIGVRRILLMPIGGMAEMDDIPRQPLREVLIAIAGPAVNFVIVGALWFLPIEPLPESTATLYSLSGFVEAVFWANLMMGCLNLLPAFPMDGGRIFRALLSIRLPYLRATFWAATVGKVVACLGIAFALTAPHWTEELPDRLYMLAVLFTFIVIVGELEYRAIRRREIEEAHWRTVLTRLYVSPDKPTEEPPLLVS